MRTPALEAAYRATRYEVATAEAGGLVLRIDEPSASLAALHARLGVRCSGLVTAWNPGSARREAGENAAAQGRLARAIAAAGFAALPAMHRAPGGGWDEPALFVPGAGQAAMLEWGRAFGQLAVVCAGDGAVPRLVWC